MQHAQGPVDRSAEGTEIEPTQGRASWPHRTLDWLASKLSRVTSSREFIPEVDGLRFVAIIPVIVLHATTHLLIHRGWTNFAGNWLDGHGPVLHLVASGGTGVQIFFVISGFIVSLPFARYWLLGTPAPSLSRYFLRRITRIEPPYILCMLVMYVLMHQYARYLPDFISGLFYLHRIIFKARNPVNIVTWSLEAEVFFYLLAPWLTQLYRIRGKQFRWLLQVLLIAAYSRVVDRLLIPYGSARWNETIATMLPFFLAGILLADLYVSGLLQPARKIGWDVAAVCSLPALVYASNGYFWRIPGALAFIIIILFASAMRGRFVNAFLRMRLITIIGGMCYSLYLWHIPLLRGIGGAFSAFTPHSFRIGLDAIVFCLLIVPVLIVAIAPIYYFLEKPFMNGPGSRYLEKLLRAAAGIFRPRSAAPSDEAA